MKTHEELCKSGEIHGSQYDRRKQTRTDSPLREAFEKWYKETYVGATPDYNKAFSDAIFEGWKGAHREYQVDMREVNFQCVQGWLSEAKQLLRDALAVMNAASVGHKTQEAVEHFLEEDL